MMRYAAISLVAVLTLSACGGGAEDEQAPAPEASKGADVVLQLPPEDKDSERPAPEAVRVEMTIPSTVQGRWGLTAADCDPSRRDAKGLLIIGPNQLEFYESVGDLQDISQIGDDGVRGTFAFTGEGMAWRREVALNADNGGRTLVRQEFGPEATPGSFRYTRCK